MQTNQSLSKIVNIKEDLLLRKPYTCSNQGRSPLRQQNVPTKNHKLAESHQLKRKAIIYHNYAPESWQQKGDTYSILGKIISFCTSDSITNLIKKTHFYFIKYKLLVNSMQITYPISKLQAAINSTDNVILKGTSLLHKATEKFLLLNM